MTADTVTTALPRTHRILTLICGLLALALACARPTPAIAIPSFAEQTGQPCVACHVGAFGPQLKQYGRDFKLNGYVASDLKSHFPPVSATLQSSFTHTNAGQPGGAGPRFAANDNPAVDQVSLYYGGRILPNAGAFIQATYDGVARRFYLDNTDLRFARDTDLLDQDIVYGFTANNAPTVSDLWNSTPVWGFPYNGSKLSPTPLASALVDRKLSQRVAGGGVYAMWNDLLYLEFGAYRGLGYDVLNASGNVPVSGSDKTIGVIPYWRAAVQKTSGRSYFQVGTYGLKADLYPGGAQSGGLTDDFTDTAVDANYQFIANPANMVSDMVSAHATIIHERAWLHASQALSGAQSAHGLTEIRADASYSFAATVTPTIQYFQSRGRSDPAYWGTFDGSPNSAGFVAEIAYVPFGKPDSPISWGNVRFAVQYVDYLKFDGRTAGASANNAVYLSVWAAAHF